MTDFSQSLNKCILITLCLSSLEKAVCVATGDSQDNNSLTNDMYTKVSQESILKWKETAIRKKIAIIGGGASGMTALKTLLRNGVEDVVLLEAQSTLGGRIRTYRQGNFHVEDGAEWIHGEKRNNVFKIAKSLNQLRNLTLDSDYEDLILREDGSVIDEDFKVAEKVRAIKEEVNENGILQDLYHEGYGQYFVRRIEEEIACEGSEENVVRAWTHFMEQRINSDEGTGTWNDISARDADHFVDFGNDWKWKNGYDTLVKHLSKSFKPANYLLNTPIKHILWNLEDSEEVLLITNNNECIAADKVIVTVSVGYLKKFHNSVFYPPIPNPLKSALQGIELGNSNKIFMGWPKRWWGNKPLSINILWTKFTLPDYRIWLYGIVGIHSVEEEQNVLQTFVSGKYSLMMEGKPEIEVRKDFLHLLRQLFNQEIPEPSFFRRTMWNSNPWTYGSYSSYITPEGSRAGLHSRAKFRKPLKNRRKITKIYWAGEHTHNSRYGTVDGAMKSGVREAHRIINHYKNV